MIEETQNHFYSIEIKDDQDQGEDSLVDSIMSFIRDYWPFGTLVEQEDDVVSSKVVLELSRKHRSIERIAQKREEEIYYMAKKEMEVLAKKGVVHSIYCLRWFAIVNSTAKKRANDGI